MNEDDSFAWLKRAFWLSVLEIIVCIVVANIYISNRMNRFNNGDAYAHPDKGLKILVFFVLPLAGIIIVSIGSFIYQRSKIRTKPEK